LIWCEHTAVTSVSSLGNQYHNKLVIYMCTTLLICNTISAYLKLIEVSITKNTSSQRNVSSPVIYLKSQPAQLDDLSAQTNNTNNWCVVLT